MSVDDFRFKPDGVLFVVEDVVVLCDVVCGDIWYHTGVETSIDCEA